MTGVPGESDSETVRSKKRALAGLLRGFDPQFVLAVGGGVRLGGQQLRVKVRGFAAVAGGPTQRGAVRGFAFAEQQVVGLSLDPLAMVEAKSLGAGTPPASRRFTAAFAGLDAVIGGVSVLRRAVVDYRM